MIKLISTLVVKRCYGVYINPFTPGNFANEKRPLKLVSPVLFAQFFFFLGGGGGGGDNISFLRGKNFWGKLLGS